MYYTKTSFINNFFSRHIVFSITIHLSIFLLLNNFILKTTQRSLKNNDNAIEFELQNSNIISSQNNSLGNLNALPTKPLLNNNKTITDKVLKTKDENIYQKHQRIPPNIEDNNEEFANLEFKDEDISDNTPLPPELNSDELEKNEHSQAKVTSNNSQEQPLDLDEFLQKIESDDEKSSQKKLLGQIAHDLKITDSELANEYKNANGTRSKEKITLPLISKNTINKNLKSTYSNNSQTHNPSENSYNTGAKIDSNPKALVAGSKIRNLSDLRQMPGNPKPVYSIAERVKGMQGFILFYAFVQSNGSVSRISMKTSSGFRSLDYKSQSALAKWKFYPGQEGWVQVPFEWNLKGGPVEAPTLLRAHIKRN